MFKRLFSGQLTVTQTYWAGFVGFNLAMRIVFIALSASTLQLYVEGRDFLVDGLFNVVLVCCVLYCIFLVRAQYRAMNNDRSPSGWSWLGLVLIVLGVVLYSYSLIALNVNGLPQGGKAIRSEVVGLNLAMPTEVSPGLIAQRVSFERGIYKIKYSYAANDLEPGRINMFGGEEADETCRDFSGYFRGPVKLLEFEYVGPEHTTIVFMTRDECLASLE